MRDLTPARQQAQLCLDCHVGNIEKGMFVTHDMYAAGHPPLPAVELRTLIEEMPRHWQSPKDLLAEGFHKTPSGQAYFTANYGVTVEGESARTATWDVQTIAVGALVAEQKWIDMLVSPNTGVIMRSTTVPPAITSCGTIVFGSSVDHPAHPGDLD